MNIYKYNIARGHQRYVLVIEALSHDEAYKRACATLVGKATATYMGQERDTTLNDYIGEESVFRIKRQQTWTKRQLIRHKRVYKAVPAS